MRADMGRFENVIIGYMLNQARMPFFMVSSYPHYTIENGNLVPDTSDDSKSLRSNASEIYDLMLRVSDRAKRGVRIPRTWISKLEAQTTLVMALEQQRVATTEWCEEFYRATRWLKSLSA